MDNKTERYMIIFNDIGLTIKGYYNEQITLIQRKKILDRLYSLIHMELFEGMQPLEEQTATVSNNGVTAVNIPQTTTNTMTNIPEPIVKRPYKHKKSYYKKHKKPEPIEPNSDISNQLPNPEPISNVETQSEYKDPVYDNEEDNQYGEFKKKGLI